MGNLLGEGFPEEIVKQVAQRQKVYGAGFAANSTRSTNQLKYLNTNTSWCKLVSSVDITTQDILSNKSLQTIPDISSNKLATKFVLFNGVQEHNKLRGGISDTNNLLGINSNGVDSAYGIGGNEFGSRPMMGIISADIKHENRGSIRRATVRIKAFNRVQFDIIDALYLRLGFNILLEWGHVSYFDNKGEYQENIGNSLEKPFLTGKDQSGENLNYNRFLKYIQARRKQSLGNYDAMFAKVSNIHWSFMPDGSYDITLDLVSIGDIIESFKVNSLNPNGIPQISSNVATPPSDPPVDPATQFIESIIILSANKNTIGQYFNAMLNQMISVDAITYRFNKLGYDASRRYVTNFTFNQSKYNNNGGTVDGVTEVSDKNGEELYCRLGNFLEFIQNNILYQVGTKDSLLPVMKIDTEVESNLIYLNPLQVSIDPRICAVNRTLNINDPNLVTANRTKLKNGIKFLKVGEPFVSPIVPPSKSEYGQIMNIYVNARFILTKMEELKDENGKLPLIDFLKGILSGINGALGGINELDVFVDEITNTIKIIDKNPMPDIKWLMEHINSLNVGSQFDTKYAEFELYGYNTTDNTAGFIKDFNFKTELTPALSTMITVGATSNGGVVGENATALSRLNNGYTDRFKEYITDNTSNLSSLPSSSAPGNIWEQSKTGRSISPSPTDANIKAQEFHKLENDYKQTYNDFIGYLIRLSEWKFTYEEISTYKDALNTYTKAYAVYKKAYDDIKNTLQGNNKKEILQPSTGFIPFNLSLTMDGLSGMKINSKFKIDASYLPSNYPETVDFLIKNLSHKIEGNKWTTMLESYCVSKGEYEESPNQAINPQGQTSQTQNTTNSTSFNVTPTYLNLPKKALIDKYGWPIVLDGTNPFTSKVISQNGGRNVYAQNPDYIKNNIVLFNYKGYNLKVHKISVDPLKKAIDLLDAQKLLPFTKIDASIYTRDTTGSPGDLSGHSFGISLDVNSAQFQYGNSGYIKYTNALADSKDPNHFQARAIKILADSKLFNWGGNFSREKDTHHFTIKPYNI